MDRAVKRIRLLILTVLCLGGLRLLVSPGATAPTVHSVSRFRDFVETPYVDGREYGMVGDGVTDNRAPLQAAVNAAVASKQELFLPAGTYLLPFTRATPKIAIGGDVKIRGAGPGRTILYDATPLTPSTGYAITTLEGKTSQKIELANVTLRGPPTSGYTPPASPSLGINSYGVHLLSNTVGSGFLRLFRVTVDGQFTACVAVDGGIAGITHREELEQCEFRSYSVSTSCFAETNTTTRSFYATDCVWHDVADLGALTGEFVYVHPNVSIQLLRCTFETNPYYAVQHYGSNPNASPLFARYIDCTWLAGCANALYLGNRGPSIVRGCVFYNSATAITVRRGTTVSNCRFLSTAVGSQATTEAAQAGSLETVQNCLIANRMHLICGGTGVKWLVSNCDAEPFASGAGTNAYSVINTASAWFTNCRVNNAGQSAGSTGFSLGGGAQTVRLRGCEVSGAWDSNLGGISISGGTGADILIEDSRFSGAGPYLLGPNTTTDAGEVRQQNNRYLGNGKILARGSSWAYGQLVERTGTTQASASTLAPDLTGATVPVTGTGTINSVILLNDPNVQRAFHGCKLRLRVLGSWSTSTAGNLLPLTTATRTVGTDSNWIYDAKTSKWVEVSR